MIHIQMIIVHKGVASTVLLHCTDCGTEREWGRKSKRLMKCIDVRVLMCKRDFNQVIQIESEGELGLRTRGITF